MGGVTIDGVEALVERMKSKVAKCVGDNGGLQRPSAELKVQFLVGLRERAESVGVSGGQGVTQAAQDCVRDAFKNQRVGVPSADPAGVEFTYTLR